MRKILIYSAVMCLCIFMIPVLIVTLGTSASFNITSSPTPSSTKTSYLGTNWPTHAIPSPSPNETEVPVTTDGEGEILIDIYDTDTKEIFQLSLEEYIVNVVIAEVPAIFELEAIKAQAVAARTYTYKRIEAGTNNEDHPGASLCTSSAHCQAYRKLSDVIDSTPDKDGNGAMKASAKIEKVRRAVEETSGLIACYESTPIEALYFACSGGMTEAADAVWDGKGYPYLVPVASAGEEIAGSRYKTSVTVTKEQFIQKIKSGSAENEKNFNADTKSVFKSITSIKKSESGRILTLKIGGVTLTGRDMRKYFNLNSTNIVFEEKDDNIVMTTYGFGHGVGLSQYGAQARAKEGMNFEEILKYYYKGIELEKI